MITWLRAIAAHLEAQDHLEDYTATTRVVVDHHLVIVSSTIIHRSQS